MADMIPAWVDGTLTPVEKLDAHRRGLRHKAVSVFVFCGDAVLLQRRAMAKYHTPGLWANTCCTHPHWEEPAGDCAVRRLKQELGLHGMAPEWLQQVEYRADVGGGMVEHEVVDLFVARLESRPRLSPDPAEVMDTDWVDWGALQAEVSASPERFVPWLRIYLRDHAETIGRGL
ncbi:MAG: isopentenyl-diphosphate Delta-isomerase [Roseivivax sp.]|nr:isopentenyl-diphosphate Delta-isomerase [Roseivivax sp.]